MGRALVVRIDLTFARFVRFIRGYHREGLPRRESAEMLDGERRRRKKSVRVHVRSRDGSTTFALTSDATTCGSVGFSCARPRPKTGRCTRLVNDTIQPNRAQCLHGARHPKDAARIAPI